MSELERQAEAVLDAMTACQFCDHPASDHRKLILEEGLVINHFCVHAFSAPYADGMTAQWRCYCRQVVDGAIEVDDISEDVWPSYMT